MPVEYDAKRDKFYLTLFDSNSTEHVIYPDYMEDLYKEIGDAIDQRKGLINKEA